MNGTLSNGRVDHLDYYAGANLRFTHFANIVHSIQLSKQTFQLQKTHHHCKIKHIKMFLIHFSKNKIYLNWRRRSFKQQSIRFISKNIGFGPQTAQPTTTRIQIIQIIRNPSPPFNQNTNMIKFKPPTPTTKLLQRNNLWVIQQNPICFLSEFITTHSRVPFPEGRKQIGEGVGRGIDGREREGVVDGWERRWNGREMEETGGEEDEEEGEG